MSSAKSYGFSSTKLLIISCWFANSIVRISNLDSDEEVLICSGVFKLGFILSVLFTWHKSEHQILKKSSASCG